MTADREVRMADRELAGVVVAAGPDGRRSTTALGRAVLAAALRPVDEPGAAAVERSTAWRSDYPAHFRRLVEAGLPDPKSWLTVAESGLAELDRQLRLARADGSEDALPAALTEAAGRELGTAEVAGTAEPERELVLPYRGRRLRGDEIRRQVEAWIGAGVAEPSLAEPVEDVLAHPEWLRLDGVTVAALGAAAEMAPVPSLLRWGATVAAVDRPVPALWERLRRTARAGAGRLLVPVDPRSGADGADLLTEVPAVADWLARQPGRLVLGTYAYADGGLHLRLSGAADVLGRRLRQRRDDLTLAFLATPTDTFAVPGDAVAHAIRRYARRSAGTALLRPAVHAVRRGRLLQPPYQPGGDPGVNDSLIPQQGPNYALAKRVQRWRAAVARAAGTPVSFHVAPSARTRSVVKHRVLAAAFNGAHHFGVEVFEPATASTLLAALLVRDLNTAPARRVHPWQDEAYAAVHGGLWRAGYAPRSVLGLALLLGALRRTPRY
jgi:hypothetical protein